MWRPPTLASPHPPEKARSLGHGHGLTPASGDLAGLCSISSSRPCSPFLPSVCVGGPSGWACLGLCGLPHPSAHPSLLDELTCSARLTVRPSLAPLFTRLLEDIEVLEGRAARFDCKISGTPPRLLPGHILVWLSTLQVLRDPEGPKGSLPR